MTDNRDDDDDDEHDVPPLPINTDVPLTDVGRHYHDVWPTEGDLWAGPLAIPLVSLLSPAVRGQSRDSKSPEWDIDALRGRFEKWNVRKTRQS